LEVIDDESDNNEQQEPTSRVRVCPRTARRTASHRLVRPPDGIAAVQRAANVRRNVSMLHQTNKPYTAS